MDKFLRSTAAQTASGVLTFVLVTLGGKLWNAFEWHTWQIVMSAIAAGGGVAWIVGRLRVNSANMGVDEFKWKQSSGSSERGSYSVLLVDDNLSAPIKDHLEARRDRVVVVENLARYVGESAIDNEFDLLMLDVRGVTDAFQASDGIAALPTVRTDNPWVPIAIYTSYPSEIRGGRKKSVDAADAIIVDKTAPFAEIEPQLLDLLRYSKSESYFASRLSKLGVLEPEIVLSAMLKGEVHAADVDSRINSLPAAQSLAARRLLSQARRRFVEKN